MDCHSTFSPFCWPHSTKTSPTALSVTSFQFALNQTLNTPAVDSGAAAAGAAACATVVGAGCAPVAGVAAAPLALVLLEDDEAGACGLAQAARASPTAQALCVRNFRREKTDAR